MTYIKTKKKKINLKAKMIVIHSILFLLVLFCFAPAYFPAIPFNLSHSLIAAVLIILLGQVINYQLFCYKLKLNSEEFLRYRFCKLCCKKEFKVDNLLENIFQSTPDIITFKDIDLKYYMCSKRFMDLFGYNTEGQIIGKTQYDFFPKAQADYSHRYLKMVIKEKVPKTYIQKFELNGKEYIYETIASPIIVNDEVVGILSLSRDIAETLHLKKSLEFSNTTLYELINNSPLMAYVLDLEGNFILGNARARELFTNGYDILASGERVKFDMDLMKSSIREENMSIIKAGVPITTERAITAHNGEKFWYKITKTPMKDSEGNYCAITIFARDIDSEKRIQEQRETYIATLSHDLKTPAIAQVRALELLLSGQLGEFNNDQKEILKLTLDSCNYLYDMVYTLLSTCKFESGEVSLNYSSIDLVILLRDSINEINKVTEYNSTTVNFNPEVEKLIIKADKIEMKRVVINLLSNAINYAFSSTEINVTLKDRGNFAELRVENQSPYIEPDIMQKIFRKYVTHSEKFNKVGVGLGLYLSKKIIEAHNGVIIAESSKTPTNTFGFIIPVSPEYSINEKNINSVIPLQNNL